MCGVRGPGLCRTNQRTVRVTETTFRPDADDKRYYVFRLPDVGEPGFYRQVVSYNAFFNSVSCRNWTNRRLFVARRPGGDWAAKYDEVPDDAIVCADIWDFYERIGFDYRRKRYRTGEIIPKRHFD